MAWTFTSDEDVNSNVYTNFVHDGESPISEVTLRANNTDRYHQSDTVSEKVVVPLCFRQTPNLPGIQAFNFGDRYSEVVSSGTFNFSRFDNVALSFRLKEGTPSGNINVVVWHWNVVTIHAGLLGLKFV